MELFSEAYKSRCIKRLKEWNAPLSGWECVYMYDVVDGDDDADHAGMYTCELCDCPKVRYVHVMHHRDYYEDIFVGCICAGIIEGNILVAKDRERKLKNRAKRKVNYLKREWRLRGNGNRTMKYKHQWLTIKSSHYGNRAFGVVCAGKTVWKYKGKQIANFLSAVHAAFDIVDPPDNGGRQ